MDALPFQPLLEWVGQNPHLSGVVVFAVAAAESMVIIGILVPGVAVMLGIGTLVGLDALPLWPTLFWAAAGAVFGDGLGYWLGHHYDTQLRHLWPMTRYPGLISKGERFFQRHGGISIVFGRFVGPVRSIIPAVAGMMHMPPGRFYLVNIFSALLWAPVVVLPGVAFGASLTMASSVGLRFAVLLSIAILLVWFVGWVLHKLLGRFVVKLMLRAHLIFNTLLRFYPQRLIGASVIMLMSMLGAGAFVWLKPAPLPITIAGSSLQQWWQGGWQSLPAYLDADKQEPLQVQWYGELPAIESLLKNHGWQVPEMMGLKNAMRWLTPDPVPAQLPIWQKSLHGTAAALVMVNAEPDSRAVLVLRLWRIPVDVKQVSAMQLRQASSLSPDRRALWVGTLDYLRAVEMAAGFYLPHETVASVSMLNRLHESILLPAVNIESKWVQHPSAPHEDAQRGRLLLVRFTHDVPNDSG